MNFIALGFVEHGHSVHILIAPRKSKYKTRKMFGVYATCPVRRYGAGDLRQLRVLQPGLHRRTATRRHRRDVAETLVARMDV